MERYNTVSANSCTFDEIIEEFTQEELQAAGVFIDYDCHKEIQVNGNKGKPNKNSNEWIKFIFLGMLMTLLMIIMSVGYRLIDQRDSRFGIHYHAELPTELVTDNQIDKIEETS